MHNKGGKALESLCMAGCNCKYYCKASAVHHVYTFNKSLRYLCLIFAIIKMLVRFLLYMFVLGV
ncbi:hypothetical protein ACE6H2_028463 [Prunus campanulata]